eukprot:16149761-Heterocapsa_arctica.AAC.1
MRRTLCDLSLRAKSTKNEVEGGVQAAVLQKIQQAPPPRTRRDFRTGTTSAPSEPVTSLSSPWKSRSLGRPEMHHAVSKTDISEKPKWRSWASVSADHSRLPTEGAAGVIVWDLCSASSRRPESCGGGSPGADGDGLAFRRAAVAGARRGHCAVSRGLAGAVSRGGRGAAVLSPAVSSSRLEK